MSSLKYDFDRPARAGRFSIKWSDEIMAEMNGKPGLLPLWVADMDFACPQPVVDAVVEEARNGIYGYSYPTEGVKGAFTDWNRRRNGWEVDGGWLAFSPGVVAALNTVVQEFTSPGDKVIVQPPVYHPFFHSIENNGRMVLENRLMEMPGGDYRMDYEDLERKTSDPAVKVAFLCNPHNPVGRVWSRDELMRFGEICIDRGILVVADEIHSDLVFSGHSYVPFASISDGFLERSITCTAPSKTFNVAGLHMSSIIIKDEALRGAFERRLEANGASGSNLFGIVAAEAAYLHGEEWLDQVLPYLEANADLICGFLRERLPAVRCRKPEGTYLAWLDFRSLGLGRDGLQRLLAEGAGLALNQGYIFGEPGEGFARLNFACPRAFLVGALERIEAAVKAL